MQRKRIAVYPYGRPLTVLLPERIDLVELAHQSERLERNAGVVDRILDLAKRPLGKTAHRKERTHQPARLADVLVEVQDFESVAEDIG